MRVGEIWQDKSDGDKIKIKTIEYSSMDKDYLITFSDLEGNEGGHSHGQYFFKQFEKYSEVKS